MTVNNYYQRNPTDLRYSIKADYPFIGSPVRAIFQWPKINQNDYTGQYYKENSLVSHLNIIRHIHGL